MPTSASSTVAPPPGRMLTVSGTSLVTTTGTTT